MHYWLGPPRKVDRLTKQLACRATHRPDGDLIWGVWLVIPPPPWRIDRSASWWSAATCKPPGPFGAPAVFAARLSDTARTKKKAGAESSSSSELDRPSPRTGKMFGRKGTELVGGVARVSGTAGEDEEESRARGVAIGSADGNDRRPVPARVRVKRPRFLCGETCMAHMGAGGGGSFIWTPEGRQTPS